MEFCYAEWRQLVLNIKKEVQIPRRSTMKYATSRCWVALKEFCSFVLYTKADSSANLVIVFHRGARPRLDLFDQSRNKIASTTSTSPSQYSPSREIRVRREVKNFVLRLIFDLLFF